jgi:hypothetical protein
MKPNKALLNWCLEEIFPDYWNVRNNIPPGMWRNCNYDLKWNNVIPFLALFQYWYIKKCGILALYNDGRIMFTM